MQKLIPVALIIVLTFASLSSDSSARWGTHPQDAKASRAETPPASAPDKTKGQKSAAPNTSTPGAQSRSDKVLLETKLVSLTVTVSDQYGRFVTGLEKNNFEVFDDGVKQEVAMFGDEDAPLTLGIIYDVSGSMSDLTQRSFAALKRLFETSHQDDEYFIIAFNNRAKLVQDFTISPSEILSRVIFVKAKGMTALYDAVYLGIEKARQGRHQKKALLLISDGEENNSRYSGRELRELIREADVPVYSIGISDLYMGSGTLENISGWSGGQAFSPSGDPRDIYIRIALMLRHQYVLGFYPSDTTSNAAWHKVRVNVKAPKGLGRLTLAYKRGYPSFR
ncbi:MAG TPA: VWA domain-containing protein [Blastocatellia bacterium]|nr:VWA domain-containing protein [Blastocatellia bacterium]